MRSILHVIYCVQGRYYNGEKGRESIDVPEEKVPSMVIQERQVMGREGRELANTKEQRLEDDVLARDGRGREVVHRRWRTVCLSRKLSRIRSTSRSVGKSIPWWCLRLQRNRECNAMGEREVNSSMPRRIRARQRRLTAPTKRTRDGKSWEMAKRTTGVHKNYSLTHSLLKPTTNYHSYAKPIS